MAETAVRSNEREAARLFMRGVAAARSGQRRVAAGLLSRAVQLNPQHELGWLWLSGVLDEPDEIAFCLRSVLSVNPDNERARQGLAWLEQRSLISAQQSTTTVISMREKVEEEEQEPERQARQEGESWWVNWRRSQRDMGRVRLFFQAGLVLLLAFVLLLNLALRDAVARNKSMVLAAAASTAIPVQQAKPTLILHDELSAVRAARFLSYLSMMEAPRSQLREAVQTYQDATNQPGGSSVTHAAAARKLREHLDEAYTIIAGMTPPSQLEEAHASYLTGLDFERAALDDMLEFYASFSIQFANRAALRMEDAERQLERARTTFDKYHTELLDQPTPAYTPR